MKSMKNKTEWVLTDPSCNQYRKTISESPAIFLFKEDRITNPKTGEKEVFEAEINLDDYTWWEIIDSCGSFGYSPKQVDKWLTEGEELDLIAECLFELTSI